MESHYIFSNGRLKRHQNNLFFVDKEENKTPLPVHQVNDVHLFGQVDLNSALFTFVDQHDICLHFYNYYGYYIGSFIPKRKKVSGFSAVNQSAHYLNLSNRLFLARSFLHGGIHHMKRNLRRHKEKAKVYHDTIESKMVSLDEATSVEQLMGIEGEIRKCYYKAFDSILIDGFKFETRSKQPPQNELNALISFGNSLAYAGVLSECYKTPIDPSISFLHEPSSRRFSLSLDIAEIFKPLLVDPIIFTVINKRVIRKEHFSQEEGIFSLNEAGRKIFIQHWEEKLKTTVKHRSLGRNVSYRYFIRLECYKLIKHFLNDEIYKPLKAWW